MFSRKYRYHPEWKCVDSDAEPRKKQTVLNVPVSAGLIGLGANVVVLVAVSLLKRPD